MENNGDISVVARLTAAAVAGLLVLLVTAFLFDWLFFTSFLAGLVIAVIVYFLLGMGAQSTSERPAATGIHPASHENAPTAAPVSETSAAGENLSAQPVSSPAEESVEAAATHAPAPTVEVAANEGSGSVSANADSQSDEATTLVKPSATLPGQEELAARKGSWTYQPNSDGSTAGKETKKTDETAAKASEAADHDAVAVDEPQATDLTTASETADVNTDGAGAGGSSVGDRPNEGKTGPSDGSASAVSDGESDLEQESQPELFSTVPADADNLKELKGVGPGLEKTLNEMGIYKFTQIASWGSKEIAWVDARLKFKGRIVRDDWVGQAGILAGGGKTEFSKKVDKGGVY